MNEAPPRIGAAEPVPDQPAAVADDGNVRILHGVTRHDIPVERVLRGALAANLSRCIVIGQDADGSLWFASTRADGGDVLWELERAKMALLRVGGAL